MNAQSPAEAEAAASVGQTRHDVIDKVLWAFVAAATVAQVFVARMANATIGETLRSDPCAGGWDNAWAATLPFTFWGGFLFTLVLLVRSVITKRRERVAIIAVVLVCELILGVICFLAADGGYGWHCPSL
ncbi:MAG: hypothetical protein EPN91_05350 [Salinibacterium sp.]|nr:MAG: hypothetical protein EPN91_05350 [Salinibacterium sp.]